jgi:hypothetical protein
MESATGEWLYDRVLQAWERADTSFRAEFHSVGSRADFFRELDAVTEMFRSGRAPILHIEAHGLVDQSDKPIGLRLSGGEDVLWEELRGHFTAMNELCHFNLLVVLAMCSGWHGASLLTPMQRAPSWGVIGTTIPDVKSGPLREAMEAFYQTLRTTLDARQALDAMNQHVPYRGWTYRLETAELMLCRVFREYVRASTEESLKEREDEIVAEIVRRHGRDLRVALDARQRAHAMLRDHAALFDHFRETFLMLDTLPMNRRRFGLTYDNCVAFQSPDA